MKLKRNILIALFIVPIVLNGCSSSLDTHKEIMAPTSSTTPFLSFRPSPIASMPLPPMTSIPALPSAQAEMKMLELLHDNGGCRLPCFLGFTPGVFDNEVFVSLRHQFDKISYGPEIRIQRNDLFLSLSLISTPLSFSLTPTLDNSNIQPDPIRWMEIDMTAYRELTTKNEKVYKNPYYARYFQYYTLPYLLSNYGPPDQVYIFLDLGIADMGLGIDLYLLHLDYTKEGWVALLEMPLYRKNGMLIGCPTEAFTSLRLWSPQDNKAATIWGFANGHTPELLTIEKATSLTLAEFYQQYKDPANTKCLETPANIQP